MVAFDQDTIITGCNDGMIRVLALQPNRFLHVLGTHPGGLGVEALTLGPERRLLASVSQDEHAYVWNLDALHDSSDEVCDDALFVPAPNTCRCRRAGAGCSRRRASVGGIIFGGVRKGRNERMIFLRICCNTA